MRSLWIALLVGFVALNVYAFSTGLDGLFAYLAGLGPWGLLVTVDLGCALLVALALLWSDARRRGVSPVPYVVATLATGSVGLLAYMAMHSARGRDADQR